MFRGKKEWVAGDSPEFEWIKAFNDRVDSIVPYDQPIEMYLEQAYPYLLANDQLAIGALIRVRGDLNITARTAENPNGGFPLLAARYITNKIEQYDVQANRYLINHELMISTTNLNHLIDLNRPEELRVPKSDEDRKKLADWRQTHWVTDEYLENCILHDKPVFKDEPIALLDGKPMTFRLSAQKLSE